MLPILGLCNPFHFCTHECFVVLPWVLRAFVGFLPCREGSDLGTMVQLSLHLQEKGHRQHLTLRNNRQRTLNTKPYSRNLLFFNRLNQFLLHGKQKEITAIHLRPQTSKYQGYAGGDFHYDVFNMRLVTVSPLSLWSVRCESI